MDIDKASSPVSDISILSRTPTPPLTSPEDLMGIPTSEQDDEQFFHPHLSLEPPRSFPITSTDWDAYAPADAPRNELSGELLRGYGNTTVALDYADFVPYSERIARTTPRQPATINLKQAAGRANKKQASISSSSKPFKPTTSKKPLKSAPKATHKTVHGTKGNVKNIKKRAASPPTFPKLVRSESFAVNSGNNLSDMDIFTPLTNTLSEHVSQEQAFDDDINEIGKRKQQLRGESDLDEEVDLPGLNASVAAPPGHPSVGALSLPVRKKTGEHNRRARALSQARVKGKFVKRSEVEERDECDDEDEDEDEEE